MKRGGDLGDEEEAQAALGRLLDALRDCWRSFVTTSKTPSLNRSR
jgi:hypothetical protein